MYVNKSENLGVPETESSKKTVIQEALELLKAWPREVMEFAKDIPAACAKIPTEENWKPVLTYLITSGILMGIANSWFLISAGPRYFMPTLFGSFFSLGIGSIVAAFLINVASNVVSKKEPGFFRTLRLFSFTSFLMPLSSFLGMITPMLTSVGTLGFLWVLYQYLQEVAGWTKKQAVILIVSLALVPVVMGLMTFAAMSGIMLAK